MEKCRKRVKSKEINTKMKGKDLNTKGKEKSHKSKETDRTLFGSVRKTKRSKTLNLEGGGEIF